MKRLITFLFFSLSAISVFSQVIISAKEFSGLLKSKASMVVVDVMAPDAYAKQHVAGAINIPHKSLYKEGPIEGQLKSPEELAVLFGKKGVCHTDKIILYDDGSQKYSSRVWWILKYLGADNVWLLHKDMGEWEQSRIPLTAASTNNKAVTFVPQVKEGMNISLTELKGKVNSAGFTLLDAREKDEYEGNDKDKRSKGHLPGAVWLNFKEVLTPTGAFKTKDEIMAVASKYGITPDREVVVYCQTGIKASTLYVALHEIAGFANVRLYAGAYAEWASDPGNLFCERKLVSDHN